jgi:serine/threonine protein kinase
LDVIHNFISDLETRINQGWLPYLAIELFDQADNLLVHCDTGFTRGRFLPTLEGLVMAIQICDILEAAHLRNIIYRDHKILHYYWKERSNGIFMIDWNIAKRFPEGLSENEVQFDLVQFGARALHYIRLGDQPQVRFRSDRTSLRKLKQPRVAMQSVGLMTTSDCQKTSRRF